ncbi:NAD(P)/FAD-dependent oxidoreductase [Ornithinibacillus halophilus]|uniref:D-amino acid dehydrogenase small subunit n=1 Tax=Ornithinibacillus halophilus TaxID=930117 RepID=A0A1M5JZ42_9BACI|nr:FAD-dependent oxidoreductase [Ornithinibacillus halophilus]SHG45560.1 D-amino acid dehydrogenase small subunit [Ornithinibacillus halophilus]
MKKAIIIGAGVLGASTAYYLAKKGIDTVLIDRNDPGQATDAAAGIICPWLSQRRNKAWYELAKGGARVYRSLVKELAADGETETGYAQVGAISIRDNLEKLQAMEKRAIERREEALEIGEVSLLTPEQTRELFPPLEENYGAVHISGAGRVNGRLLRKALMNAAKKHGATVIQGSASLIQNGKAITGVQVNDETYEADYVIAASGAWMNDLLEPIGIEFKGSSQKGQLMHLQLPDTDTSTWPLLLPPSDQSIVPFDDHIVIGATHEDDVGFDQRVTAGGVHELLTKAFKFAPGLENSTVKDIKVGFRPFTPGFLPVFGEMPGYEGLILANGLGASGLTTGPFVGMQLAKLVLGEALDVDQSNYDVNLAL